MAFKNDFRPDIIAGNPPYNNGMDIDFVFNAFDIARIAISMVVPGKWQTCAADQRIDSTHSYGEFREKIVPHMDKVVFYPDCKDIFDIFQTDGITIYTLDKNKVYDKCVVENRSRNIDIFNNIETRVITEENSLLNIGNEIIEHIGSFESFIFPNISHNKKYEVWINTKVSGFDWYNTKEPRYVISIARILDVEAGETYDGEAKCIFESDLLDECYSFMSWIYSKPVRFLLIPNISKLNNIFTEHCFRFVPKITEFKHIYSDDELYSLYNMSEYKDIVDKLVKKRDIYKM